MFEKFIIIYICMFAVLLSGGNKKNWGGGRAVCYSKLTDVMVCPCFCDNKKGIEVFGERDSCRVSGCGTEYRRPITFNHIWCIFQDSRQMPPF